MICLRQCNSCWYVFDDELVRSGKHEQCPCGDKFFRPINPTWFNILKYLVFQKRHAIKRIMEREHGA